jgi:hypothetical protein
MKLKPTWYKQCLLLFMVIVSRLTAQTELDRTLEKVIHSFQSSNHAQDLSKPPSSVSGICVPDKKLSFFCLYKLHSQYRNASRVRVKQLEMIPWTWVRLTCYSFEVLTVVEQHLYAIEYLSTFIFWFVTPRGFIGRHQHIWEMYLSPSSALTLVSTAL